MFETEIKEIRSKLAKSLILWREADKLEKKIRKEEHFKNDTVYWIGHSLKSNYYIYEYAIRDLSQKVTSQLGENFRLNGYNAKCEFDKICNEARNITNGDVLDKLKQCINSKGWRQIEPEVNGNNITVGLSDYNLSLLLTSLNILINNEIETAETIDKARKVLNDDNNTFIYKNIKITIYKNGKTKLTFADKEILNKFKGLLVA